LKDELTVVSAGMLLLDDWTGSIIVGSGGSISDKSSSAMRCRLAPDVAPKQDLHISHCSRLDEAKEHMTIQKIFQG
jgi:hypothetical protein